MTAEQRARKEAEEREVWESLAAEAVREQARLAHDLAKLQAAAVSAPPAAAATIVAQADQAAEALNLDEADTRRTFEVDDRHLRGWDNFALAADRLPASAPILVAQATAFCIRGKTEERVAFLGTPVYAKGWRHRLLWKPLPAMSDTALVSKQKSLRKDYGLEQLLASDAGANK